jgi:DNA-binding NarL/FixJ family response regulator
MSCNVPSRNAALNLRVLLVDQAGGDGDLVIRECHRVGMRVTAQRVDSREAFTRALEQFAPDVVLSHHSGAPVGPLAALELVQAVRPTAALIVVAGALDEAALVAYLRAGAADLVLTHNLTRLAAAVEGAVAQRRPLQALSPRQLEVLRLVASGSTTGDIAQRLKLSVKTVEAHRAEVMRRLDIHNLAGLVRFAIRVGLISAQS